jgi:hypothetical protein
LSLRVCREKHSERRDEFVLESWKRVRSCLSENIHPDIHSNHYPHDPYAELEEAKTYSSRPSLRRLTTMPQPPEVPSLNSKNSQQKHNHHTAGARHLTPPKTMRSPNGRHTAREEQ